MKKFIKTIILTGIFTIVSAGAIYAYNNYCNNTEGITITRKCRTCKGERTIREKTPHYPCDQKGCAACDYKGWTMNKVTCPTCGGTGKEKIRR